MQRGSNLVAVGSYNQALVLDRIRRASEGISRVELAELTGLSPQTLTNVTRRLGEEGLIVEAGRVISGPGKPRTILTLNPRSRFAVGVHLDPAVDTTVVVDLAGEIVATLESPPPVTGDHPALLEGIARSVDDVVAASRVDRDRILGIGVAAPGPLDTVAGSLLDPPLLPAWHGVRVREGLSAITGVQVVLEKDVVAAMTGEQWGATGDDIDEALFFYLGAGVGVGLAVDGSAIVGPSGNAGNVAHLLVDPDGPPCSCGSFGCLGVTLEPERLLVDGGVWPADEHRGAVDSRDALDELARRALAGDPRASAAIDRAARAIARGIVTIADLLESRTVIVGGPVWQRLAESLRPALDHALLAVRTASVLGIPHIRESRLGTDVAAVGAACLMLTEAFAARPESLMISS